MPTEGGLPGALDQNDNQQHANLNISDVFEAITIADPSGAGAVLEDDMARPPPPGAQFVRIVEQPASKALRFRYECEGRSAGSIPGVNSTQDRKTYPTIEICGHTGKAIVVVSCVTKDEPYRPHPHNLVGRDRCNRGVCTLKTEVSPDNALVSFSNLGIQCVKRRDIPEALRVREELRVDPFRTGYGHRSQPQSIDLNAVRLCFQVFLPDDAGKIRHSLPPVVSDVIYDKKAMSDLQILRVSQSSGSVLGGTELILLCEKVTREDIAVVVCEEGPNGVQWEESANIIIVHKQVAIAFTTPAYRDTNTSRHIEVQIQLKRVSDNARSVGISFTYIPQSQDSEYLKRKRQKTLSSSVLQKIEQERAAWIQEQKPIKSEPSGSPLHMGGSPRRVYTPLEQVPEKQYQQWMPDSMQGGLPGPSSMNPPFYADLTAPWPGTRYAQPISPGMQVPGMQSRSSNLHMATQNMPAISPGAHHRMSPGMQVISPPEQSLSPGMPSMSPGIQVMSPGMQVMSPQRQVMSPQAQAMSPQGQVMSPQGQVMSPQGQVMSPQGHVMSPHMAMDTDVVNVNRNFVNVSPNLVQQPLLLQQQPMEGSSNNLSLSNLLMDRGEGAVLFNSGDLSSLSAILNHAYRPNELSDSLNRLSTSDLLNPAEL